MWQCMELIFKGYSDWTQFKSVDISMAEIDPFVPTFHSLLINQPSFVADIIIVLLTVW